MLREAMHEATRARAGAAHHSPTRHGDHGVETLRRADSHGYALGAPPPELRRGDVSVLISEQSDCQPPEGIMPAGKRGRGGPFRVLHVRDQCMH